MGRVAGYIWGRSQLLLVWGGVFVFVMGCMLGGVAHVVAAEYVNIIESEENRISHLASGQMGAAKYPDVIMLDDIGAGAAKYPDVIMLDDIGAGAAKYPDVIMLDDIGAGAAKYPDVIILDNG